jgi:hypothetical protein
MLEVAFPSGKTKSSETRPTLGSRIRPKFLKVPTHATSEYVAKKAEPHRFAILATVIIGSIAMSFLFSAARG